jgi:hypothetical protein
MPRKHVVKLPPDVNHEGLLTFRKASEISGIPLKTLYEWRRQPWRGLRVYRLGRKIFVKANEFQTWINVHIRTADGYGRFAE